MLTNDIRISCYYNSGLFSLGVVPIPRKYSLKCYLWVFDKVRLFSWYHNEMKVQIAWFSNFIANMSVFIPIHKDMCQFWVCKSISYSPFQTLHTHAAKLFTHKALLGNKIRPIKQYLYNNVIFCPPCSNQICQLCCTS